MLLYRTVGSKRHKYGSSKRNKLAPGQFNFVNRLRLKMSLRTISFATMSLLILLSGNVAVVAQNTAPSRSVVPFKLVQTIPLPDVTGGMNHLDADAKRQRFFVTAPGQQKVVVV